MKKIFVLLAALVLFAGCDDGDMTFKTFNFQDGAAPKQCTLDKSVLYQINGTEVLIMNLSESLFLNIVSPTDGNGAYIPTRVAVGSNTSYKMYYRNYSSTANDATICSSSGTPNVLEQWTGNGSLLITTTELRNTSGVLTGYSHAVVIESATFSNGEQEITITDNQLGSFSTTLGFTFNFNNTSSVLQKCTDRSVYKISNADGKEVLDLKLFKESYFTSSAAEQTINLATVDNDNFYFRRFVTTVGSNNICTPSPTDPVQEQVWLSTGGNLRIIRSASTDFPGQFNYEIRLYQGVFISNANGLVIYRPENTNTDENGTGYYAIGIVTQ